MSVKTHLSRRKRVLHRLTWLNICIQLALPVMAGVAPAVHAAAMNDIRTTTYTLGSGESAASVAKKYNLTVTELKKLNQLRTFAHGFDHLQSGDELDVPAQPLTNDAARSPFAVDREAQSSQTETHLAQLAAQTGQMLASGNSADAASSMAQGQVTGMAGAAAQDWLKRFGNARVSLGTDHNFNLADSSLELLTPYYDSKENLVYGQWNVHHADKRTQGNVGVGVRHFRDSDMLGANLFADYDFSQSHTRAGVGVEYWRDNLKLAANGYMGLSGWKNSDLLHDYEEKVADGWDVRAEGYLPSYPALGAKLQYEQYYGDKVALFGHDSLQKNASALTAGVTWTPVPLVTVGVDQRTGREGKSETEFNLALNYRFGDRLSDLLDASQVGERRSLAGSRYDMVDRNNNIVLKYRKKQVIKMSMVSQVSGVANAEVPLNVHVNAAHGLREIVWDQSELVNAGGALKGEGSQWSVVIPAAQADGRNSWSISGVAYDNEGNASERVYSQVINTGGNTGNETPDQPQLDQAEITADGSTTLTLTLKDGSGQPLTGQAEHLKLNIAANPSQTRDGEATLPTNDPFQDNGNGVYTTTIHANGSHGEFTLTPTLDGQALPSVELIVDAEEAGEEFMAMASLTPATVAPEATSTLTVTLTDAANNAVTGKASNLSASDENGLAMVGKFTEVEGTPGTYTAQVTAGNTAGTATLNVKLDDEKLTDATLTIQADEMPTAEVSLTDQAIEAQSTTTLTVKLSDSQGAVTGKADELRATATAASKKDKTPTIGDFTESDEAGTYTATVNANSASGAYTLTVTLDDENVGSTSLTVSAPTVVAGPSTATLKASSIEANSGTTELTLELKDADGNALNDQQDALLVSFDGVVISGTKPTATSFTQKILKKGTYTAIITAGSHPAIYKVYVKLNGVKVQLNEDVPLELTVTDSE